MQNGGIENQRGEDAAACRESGEKGVLRLCAVKGSADENENEDDCGGGQVALIQPQREKEEGDGQQGACAAAQKDISTRRGKQQSKRVNIRPRQIGRVGNGEGFVHNQQGGEQGDIPFFVEPEKLCHQHARKKQKHRGKQTDDRRHGYFAAEKPIDGLQIAAEGGLIDRLTLLSQKHGVAAEAEGIIAEAVRQKGEQQRKKSACLISGSALEEHAIPAFVQK